MATGNDQFARQQTRIKNNHGLHKRQFFITGVGNDKPLITIWTLTKIPDRIPIE